MTVHDGNGGRPALFLDRDGTLNVDHGYVDRPERVDLVPGAAQAVAAARGMGMMVIVVSNQSGVGRGYFGAAAMHRVNDTVRARLQAADAGATLDGLYSCPHAPARAGEAGCDCRKPAPGMILRAAREHGIDLTRSWTVGDKPSDVAAGRAAGTRTILISPDGDPDGADFGARDLAEAVDRIRKVFG